MKRFWWRCQGGAVFNSIACSWKWSLLCTFAEVWFLCLFHEQMSSSYRSALFLSSALSFVLPCLPYCHVQILWVSLYPLFVSLMSLSTLFFFVCFSLFFPVPQPPAWSSLSECCHGKHLRLSARSLVLSLSLSLRSDKRVWTFTDDAIRMP